MKDRYGNRRYHASRERRDHYRDWHRASGTYREDTSARHPRSPIYDSRDNQREERPSEWDRSRRSDYTSCFRNTRSCQDTKIVGHDGWCEYEAYVVTSNIKTNGNDGWCQDTIDVQTPRDTKTKGHNGWGDDSGAPADVTSGWETIALNAFSDWSKPPQIESVEYWDDSGAKETWELLQTGHLPLEDPDLYMEKGIDWELRRHLDIPVSADDKRRFRTVPTSRSRSPVILGLESLDPDWKQKHLQGAGLGKSKRSRSNWSKKEHEKGGGGDGWGAMDQVSPAWQETKQQSYEQMSGLKRKTLERNDYKDKVYRNRSGPWQGHVPGWCGLQTGRDEQYRKSRY